MWIVNNNSFMQCDDVVAWPVTHWNDSESAHPIQYPPFPRKSAACLMITLIIPDLPPNTPSSANIPTPTSTHPPSSTVVVDVHSSARVLHSSLLRIDEQASESSSEPDVVAATAPTGVENDRVMNGE